MAVESMLAKQRARVPELEVRGLGLVEPRRGRVQRATAAAQLVRHHHRCRRCRGDIGGCDLIAPQTPQRGIGDGGSRRQRQFRA